MEKVTMKDVAKLAKVSIATVSRVINENPSVKSEIKERVLQAIEKLNYRPNTIARSLKTNHTGTIAFLVTNISDYFFTAISRGIEQVIKQHDYNLIVCSNDNSKETEKKYLQMLQEKQVSCIILNTTGKNNEYITELSNHLPIILSNRKIKNENFKGDFVDFDNTDAVYRLTKHLISLGHRKIGVINGPLYLSTAHERFEGFKKAMKEINIEVDENYPFNYNGSFISKDGYRGVKYLLEKDDQLTAIVMMNSEIALGAYKYFISNNINIPEDLSVVSFGDILNKELLFVNPTISYTDLKSLGNKLGEVAIERVENKSLNVNREFRFMTQIQYGESTSKPSISRKIN